MFRTSFGTYYNAITDKVFNVLPELLNAYVEEKKMKSFSRLCETIMDDLINCKFIVCRFSGGKGSIPG